MYVPACPDNCLVCTYDSVTAITKCNSGQCASGYAQTPNVNISNILSILYHMQCQQLQYMNVYCVHCLYGSGQQYRLLLIILTIS